MLQIPREPGPNTPRQKTSKAPQARHKAKGKGPAPITWVKGLIAVSAYDRRRPGLRQLGVSREDAAQVSIAKQGGHVIQIAGLPKATGKKGKKAILH